MMAFCKYRTPPWINLVLRLLVPQEKSSLSTKAVERPVKTTILCFVPFFFQNADQNWVHNSLYTGTQYTPVPFQYPKKSQFILYTNIKILL